MIEVEKWSPLFVGLFWTRGIKWEVAQGDFWVLEMVLNLDLGSCYTSIYTCINSESCTFKICVLCSKVIYKVYI